jgi:hypothetical protein
MLQFQATIRMGASLPNEKYDSVWGFLWTREPKRSPRGREEHEGAIFVIAGEAERPAIRTASPQSLPLGWPSASPESFSLCRDSVLRVLRVFVVNPIVISYYHPNLPVIPDTPSNS